MRRQRERRGFSAAKDVESAVEEQGRGAGSGWRMLEMQVWAKVEQCLDTNGGDPITVIEERAQHDLEMAATGR